ncbi:MAG: DUF4340 domain-containing protein [Thermodesulfobacteriota bacterium]|nr:DUF4340 domain-containing protein [Thermodesulfobacteriota bacterium]
MKTKKEFIILVAIIIALSLYLMLRNPDRTNYQLPETPTVAAKDITRMEITRKDSSINMKKKLDTWHIVPQEYVADTQKAKEMLDAIEGLTLTALASEAKDYGRYDLTSDKRITVRAWAGDTLKSEFDVGKAASSYRHTFVKIVGDHRVYHAKNNFRGKFDQSLEDLRDKAVLSFEKEEIREIGFTKDKESIVLIRKELPAETDIDQDSEAKDQTPPKTETVWESAEGKKADESEVGSLLSTLSSLRCDAYVDDRKSEDYTDPVFTVRLNGEKGYTLSIYDKTDKEDKKYPTISSENDYPFLLSDWQAEKIMAAPDKILKDPDES